MVYALEGLSDTVIIHWFDTEPSYLLPIVVPILTQFIITVEWSRTVGWWFFLHEVELDSSF